MQEKKKISWNTTGEVIGADAVMISDSLADSLDHFPHTKDHLAQSVINFALFVKIGSMTQPVVGELASISVNPEGSLVKISFNVITDDALKAVADVERWDVVGYEITYNDNAVTTVMRRFVLSELVLKEHRADLGTCALDISLTL